MSYIIFIIFCCLVTFFCIKTYILKLVKNSDEQYMKLYKQLGNLICENKSNIQINTSEIDNIKRDIYQ